MLSIVHVGALPFPTHQGTQVYVGGLCRGLAARGHRVSLVTWGAARSPDLPGVDVVRCRPVPGAPERSGPHWSRLPQDVLLARVLARVLRERDPDVVHAHHVEAPVIARLVRRRSAALVYGAHTTLRDELPTYGSRGRRAKRWLGALADAAVPGLCDAGVALSEPGADALRRAGLRRVATIPPGVEPDEVAGGSADRARRRWRLGDGPWVVYCGNADGYQDLPDLLGAIAVGRGLRLLLVTGSPLGPLREQARRAGVPSERLRLVRSTSLDDTRDALAAAAVAAVPRRVCTGFPMKVLNQLAVGVPTVATVGGVGPLAGVVRVPAGHVGAFARALQRLVDDAEARRDLGEQGRRAVEEGWRWHVRCAQLDRFYRSLLATG